MAIYSDLSKLGRVSLPSGSTYALIDVDGRAIIAPNFSAEGTYAIGEHVIYGDNLYRAKAAISTAGSWDSSDWDLVTVDSEIRRIEGLIAGGIHYRGKTTTGLYEGATTNPISIGGNSYTASTGDLVIFDTTSATVVTYTAATAYAIHTYIKNDGIVYITTAAITADENTGINAIASKISVVEKDPEFLFDGVAWNALGSISDGLGDLAFKDTASGTYIKPTGSGSVTINTYTPEKKKLSTTTITGTDGTVNASNITNVATSAFATAAATATTVAVAAGTTTLVGNADVGDSVAVGTSLSGTTTFNTDAIKAAALTGTTTFNTDAIKAASLTGTTTFTTEGITTSVSGDCLTFSTSGTGTVGISTTAASTGTVGISTTEASTASVSLSTTNITPAKAVSSTSTSITAVGGTTDIRGVSGTADAVTGVTYSAVTPAKVASSATTVATGSLESGTDIVTGVTAGTTSATVTVGTTTDTVTVS